MSGGYRNYRTTSGLPQTADMAAAHSLFSSGPLPDSCIAANYVLFDQLVGAGEQGWRHQDLNLSPIAISACLKVV
ncbi:hypothetical protein CWO91_34505 [Bradyrhizobium genosp. SA-3]|nr:hypothetical protein CWO91_34505 [Bradyrhizobium genosp. SA-3]